MIIDTIFATMRIKGTKYDTVDTLPAGAQVVSKYARDAGTAVGYIYIKYERYLQGKGSRPPYTIKCFNGINFVIPE